MTDILECRTTYLDLRVLAFRLRGRGCSFHRELKVVLAKSIQGVKRIASVSKFNLL